jgi:hypothetical protein
VACSGSEGVDEERSLDPESVSGSYKATVLVKVYLDNSFSLTSACTQGVP